MNIEPTLKYSRIRNDLEGQDLVLPRDVFSSRFSYDLVTRKRFYLCSLLLMVASFIFLTWLRIMGVRVASVVALAVFTCLIMLLVLPTVYLISGERARAKARTAQNTLSFLKEVIKIQPGLDFSKWDRVAARLNKIFHENDNSITPYYFYSGSECSSCFNSWYVVPSLRKQVTGQLQPIIDEAVQVHQANLDDHWRQFMETPSAAGGDEVPNA